MAKTVEEWVEYIVHEYDVDLICELLDVESEELLYRFDDKLMIAIDRGVFDDEPV